VKRNAGKHFYYVTHTSRTQRVPISKPTFGFSGGWIGSLNEHTASLSGIDSNKHVFPVVVQLI
jgi:hypothetical protein